MLQRVAEICSKLCHVRLLCLLGHLLRGVSLRSNWGDLRVRGRILGQEKLGISSTTDVVHLDLSTDESA